MSFIEPTYEIHEILGNRVYVSSDTEFHIGNWEGTVTSSTPVFRAACEFGTSFAHTSQEAIDLVRRLIVRNSM